MHKDDGLIARDVAQFIMGHAIVSKQEPPSCDGIVISSLFFRKEHIRCAM
jgi:hypothetical protein